MTSAQDTNAEIVLRHITSLNARRTTYMGIGTIAGLVSGLAIGCVLVFVFNCNQRWIGLGLIGMVFGSFGGALAGRIRRNDLEAITGKLQSPCRGSDKNKTAANNTSEHIP